jgi:dienelactone hydrolase
VLSGLALAAGCAPRGASSSWWSAGALRPGPQPVGVTVSMLVDSARVSPSGRLRLVQMTTWYPAGGEGGETMTYADYVRLADTETTHVAPPDLLGAVASRRAFLVSSGVPEGIADEWFGAPVLARRDAAPAGSRHPVVLIAQGNGETAVDQSLLAEFLASHGYVVATSPSQSRVTGEPTDVSRVAAAAADQADDLALMREALAERPGADANDVAIVSHSFGARSALYEAMRDSRVRRIVSLDGGIGAATAREAYEGDALFEPGSLRIPLLHFYETLDKEMKPDWATLRRLTAADVWIARTDDLHHHHFTDLGTASARYPDMARATGATQRTGEIFAMVLQWTLAFLGERTPIDASAFPKRVPSAALIQPHRLNP